MQPAVSRPRNKYPKSQPFVCTHHSDRHWPFVITFPVLPTHGSRVLAWRKPCTMTGIFPEATAVPAPLREASKVLATMPVRGHCNELQGTNLLPPGDKIAAGPWRPPWKTLRCPHELPRTHGSAAAQSSLLLPAQAEVVLN